ncbi:MAG: catecholate siderophore receptor [Sphingomonadales bacterium]|jgi:catecholate siderophore receptor|nr:catecholate siderophore receptor [Sphingomonadales bacterium]
MLFRSVSVFALAGALAAPAFAAELDEAALDTEATVVVTGQRPEYGAKETCTATKTCTDVQDVPQSISIVTESQIEDQALRSIADVLLYVPGATSGTGEGNRDQIILRGNNTTADFFVNGVRDDVQYFRDLYNAERIEVLRGPNAMIFGRGGGGGIVNRVTKRSGFKTYREFAAQGDSEGGVRLTGDLDQPLGGSLGLRLNGVYENGESFRRRVELERYGVNPVLGARFGDTRIDLSFEYFHDRRTADRGVPSSNGRPLRGFDRIFFGDPDVSFARVDAHIVSLAVEHRFSDAVTLRNRTSYGDYDKFYQNVLPGAINAAGTGVALSAYNNKTKRQNLFSQTDLVLEGDLGGLSHTLLLGFEIGDQDSFNRRLNGFFVSAANPAGSPSITVPLAAPTIASNVLFLPVNTNAARTPANYNRGDASILAFYAQEQLRVSDRFEIVAGLRYDRFKLDVLDLNSGSTFSRADNLFSPRLGVIFKPVSDLSFYASYGRSYLPSSGDQFGSLDVTSQALKPERFDNYEIGAKWQPIPGLLATVAAYRLDRTNTRAVDPLTNLVVLTGAQRSKGLEIGLERNITDKWQISAGYAFQEAEITRTTAAAPKGREVPLVPRHQFSVWNRYDVSKTLGFGLGVIAATKSYVSISNAVTLPGYARVDAAVFYELADGIEAQVNVENLLGGDYFPSANSDNNIAPGAPTTARATLRFRF